MPRGDLICRRPSAIHAAASCAAAPSLAARIRHLVVADNTRGHLSLTLQATDGGYGTHSPFAQPNERRTQFRWTSTAGMTNE